MSRTVALCAYTVISVLLLHGCVEKSHHSPPDERTNGATAKMDTATMPREIPNESDEDARSFLKALLEKDMKTLYQYADGGAEFFEGVALREEIREFLYEDRRDWRSVSAIAQLDTISVTIVPHRNGIVTVLYVPTKYKSDLDKKEFLTTAWMKKYFACEFDTTRRAWRLHENFCFAETDGPYPPGYSQ